MNKIREKIKLSASLISSILIVLAILIIGAMPKKTNPIAKKPNPKKIEVPQEVRTDKDTLKISVDDIFEPLNPFFESSKDPSIFTKLIHRSLFRLDKQGLLQPDLAEEFWTENNGKDLHLVLKKGQKFPDGKTITAKDVIKNIKVLADPSYDGPKSYMVERIGGYYSFKKKNDKEGLKIFEENPYYLIISWSKVTKENQKFLELPIVELDDKLIKYGDLTSIRAAEFPSGAGDYKIARVNDGTYELIKNTNKKGIASKLSIVSHKYFQAKNLYSRGEIDILYKYPAEEFYQNPLSQREDQFTYYIKNQDRDYVKIGFNLRDGYFTNDDMRLALFNSLKFDEILGLRDEERIYSPVYKSFSFFEKERPKYEGLSLKDLTITSEDKTVSLAIYKNLTDIVEKKQALIDAFAKEGLKLTIDEIDDSKMYDLLLGNHKYDMFIVLDQMFTIPSMDNQLAYYNKGKLSSNVLDDRDNIETLKWLGPVFGYENYSYALYDWQTWYYKKLPYFTIKGKNQITAINKRIKGLYINEFVDIDDSKNLKAIFNVLN